VLVNKPDLPAWITFDPRLVAFSNHIWSIVDTLKPEDPNSLWKRRRLQHRTSHPIFGSHQQALPKGSHDEGGKHIANLRRQVARLSGAPLWRACLPPLSGAHPSRRVLYFVYAVCLARRCAGWRAKVGELSEAGDDGSLGQAAEEHGYGRAVGGDLVGAAAGMRDASGGRGHTSSTLSRHDRDRGRVPASDDVHALAQAGRRGGIIGP